MSDPPITSNAVMTGRADAAIDLCLIEPAEAQAKSGGDQAVQQDDLDADGNSKADVSFRVRSGPSASAEAEKDEANRHDEIAFDQRDNEVDRDECVRNDDQESRKRQRQRSAGVA